MAALLTQRDIEEAAKSIQVDPQTLLRWLKVTEFQNAFREAKGGGATAIDIYRYRYG